MSASWHRQFSSQALVPFTKGEALPYRMDADGVVVTRATARPGVTWGHPHKHGDLMHLIDELAAAWTPGGMRIGARWLCGRTSIGARLWDPDTYWAHFGECYGNTFDPDDIVCAKCRRVRDGVDHAVVYRVYDDSGERLIYIGSTKDWSQRRNAHRQSTWWWRLAGKIDLEDFDSLAAARDAEREAIKAERPWLNIVHNRRGGAA